MYHQSNLPFVINNSNYYNPPTICPSSYHPMSYRIQSSPTTRTTNPLLANQEQNLKVFVFDEPASSRTTQSSSSVLDTKKANSIHRLLLKQVEIQQLSFKSFVQLLINRSILKVSTTQPKSNVFDMFFLDDESEWVSLADDNDWRVLWSVLRGQKLIKIALVRRGTNNKKTLDDEEAERVSLFNKRRIALEQQLLASRKQRNTESCPFTFRRVVPNQQQQPQHQSQPQRLVSLFDLLNRTNKVENNSHQKGCGAVENILENVLDSLFESSTPVEKKEEKKQEQPISLKQLLLGRVNTAGKSSIPETNKPGKDIPHVGITCDGCGEKNFSGQRWNCTDCDDFDFCGKCFEEKAKDHSGGFHSFEQAQPSNFLYNLIQKFKNDSSCQQPKQEQETEQAKKSTEHSECNVAVAATTPQEVVEPTSSNLMTTSQLLSSNYEFNSTPIVASSQQEQQDQLEESNMLVQPQQESSTIASAPSFSDVIVETTAVDTPIVEEQVVITPPTTPAVEDFTSQLVLLKDMGFFGDEENLRVLRKYGGDIQRTVSELINNDF